MSRTRVLDLAALPPGGVELLVVRGIDVALFRRGDEFFAIGNECAHKGGNPCEGRVDGDIVTCPLHGWEFDLRSGVRMTIPGEAVPRFAVTVDDGGIYLEDSA